MVRMIVVLKDIVDLEEQLNIFHFFLILSHILKGALSNRFYDLKFMLLSSFLHPVPTFLLCDLHNKQINQILIILSYFRLARCCLTFPLCCHSQHPSIITTTLLRQVDSCCSATAFEEDESSGCIDSYYYFSSFTRSPSGLSHSSAS